MSVASDIDLARLTLPAIDQRPVDPPRSEPMPRPDGTRPRALLLQGPVGPFMGDLRAALKRGGFAVRHVVFNLADLMFAGHGAFGPDITVYRGAEGRWSDWLQGQLSQWRPDVIVLFGCERQRHAAARALADRFGIPVLSLEEGYVRPGYVTAEWGGNNRRSPLATLPDETIAALARRPTPKPAGGREFNAMARWGFAYYVVRWLGFPIFPRAVHHKHRPLVSETVYWLRSAWRKVSRYVRNRTIVDGLVEHERGRFFVMPLQVRDDMQLECAGRGWTNERLIEEGIASFAAHAPRNRRLVVKVHPLERGHSYAFQEVREAAERHGVADRVDVVDDGSIGLLVSASAGMLTINSTSAFAALLRKVPLGVLGDAPYRRPELSWPIDSQSDLDAFWTQAKPGDPVKVKAFRQATAATALLPGDYYRGENRRIAAEAIVERIQAGLVVTKERAVEQRRADAVHVRAEARTAEAHPRRAAAAAKPRSKVRRTKR